MKHTNGPWKVNKWDDDGAVDGFTTVITDTRGVSIAQFTTFGKSKKVEANAKLISKAPDMADLLKKLLNTQHRMERTPELNVIINKAREIVKEIK